METTSSLADQLRAALKQMAALSADKTTDGAILLRMMAENCELVQKLLREMRHS